MGEPGDATEEETAAPTVGETLPSPREIEGELARRVWPVERESGTVEDEELIEDLLEAFEDVSMTDPDSGDSIQVEKDYQKARIRLLARLRTAEHSEEVEAERCQQCGGEMVGASGHNLDGSDQDWYGCGSCGWDDLQPMVEAIARLRDGKLTLTIGVQTFVIHVPRNDAEEDFGVRLEWYKRQLDAALRTLTGKGTE